MTANSKPVGLCEAPVQAKVEKLKNILGISLPDCAQVTVTREGGVLATSTNALGTEIVVEINPQGKVFQSTYCGEATRGMISYVEHIDRPTTTEPACRDFNRVQQTGSVSLDKLAKARAMLLGTDKPKAK